MGQSQSELFNFSAQKKSEPFLRWAGGKRWLVPVIRKLLSRYEFDTYHEPFLGGGAIFFGLFEGEKAVLSDLNSDLINCYEIVKKQPYELISILEKLENSKEQFLRFRELVTEDPIERASRFIYLNRTAFNGIYRVNQQGRFNVPYGRPDIKILEAEKLLRSSNALKNSLLLTSDFNFKERYRKGDFVFLDPPYSFGGKKSFVSYNSEAFGLEDQMRLSKLVEYFEIEGISYVLTNSAHPEVRELFGFCKYCNTLSRREGIAADPNKRKLANELIFSNVEGLENATD